MFQRSGHAKLLPRCTQCDSGPPAQPVGTAAETATPAFPLIELTQHDQHSVRGRVQVRGQLGDLIT
jgi:hypothetical protein